MKSVFSALKIVILGALVVALCISDSMARGGCGGGVSRPSASRTPTMSRPSTAARPAPRPATATARPAARPSTPAAATRPATGAKPGSIAGGAKTPGTATRPATGAATRPATGVASARPTPAQVGNFLNMPVQKPGGPGAGAATRPAGANPAVANFLQKGPATGANRPSAGTLPSRGAAAKVANRGGERSKLSDARNDRATSRQRELGDVADSVRDGLHDHYDHDHLFDDFWSDHGFHENPLFWTWATWNTMAAFMPWNWGEPYYYDYGSGGNVYYEGDTVYSGETAIPAEEYAAQAEELATSVPEVTNPDQVEWLPLGVFALAPDDDPNAVPNLFLQLAVSKEGIIAGNLQNKTSGKTDSIEGMVDSKTQRAAWTITGKSSPIMESGVFNLTKNETRALVHFADGQTQQWLMVRVEGPGEAK